MSFGICHLGAVAIRETADHHATMLSQLLYGDLFKIKEKRKHWSRVKTTFDSFEGWVANNQIRILTEQESDLAFQRKEHFYNVDLVSFVSQKSSGLTAIPLGAEVSHSELFGHTFEGGKIGNKSFTKTTIVEIASLYLNSPYLIGGKTPFGIDNSGFSQMVYKMSGQVLRRTVEEQSNQGEVLSFIEECEPGDLAFFDDNEGVIHHVGIVLEDNYIIHADGKVRIDRIDHTGIFNAEEKRYSHKLRVLKRTV